MNKGKIIIIEGTSCVGKTTVCSKISENGDWIIIPEAIRYLEKETHKISDEASPIPNKQQEEEFFQRELLRIEMQRIKEANEWANAGNNVLMDKSFIATMATAYAFEKIKQFNGTFQKSVDLYYNDLYKYLSDCNLIYYDKLFLLTADFDVILKRNELRNHVLDGIWITPELLKLQREFLEKFVTINKENSVIIDTSDKTKEVVEQEINYCIDSITIKKGMNKNDRFTRTL